MSTTDGLGALLKINQQLNANQFRIFFFLCERPHGDHFEASTEYLERQCRLTANVLEQEVSDLKFRKGIHISYVRGMTSSYVLWEIER